MQRVKGIFNAKAPRAIRKRPLIRDALGLIGLLVGAVSIARAGGCRREAPAPEQTKRVKVFVSIDPHAFFVERIGSEHVDVEVLVRGGGDPHTFELTPKQVARLTRAGIYFRAGLPFERMLLGKIPATAADLEIVDTREGIDLLEIQHEREDHRTGDEHGAPDLDPHVWLSPRLAKIQAETICRSLSRIDPAHADTYARNLSVLQSELDALDARIAKVLEPLKGRTFFVFHPAFGYFASSYGLKQKAVETGGKSPGARHIKRIIDQARRENVKVIFVQPQFSPRAAETIAEQIGAAVLPMDPLERDYIANMAAMADKICGALGQGDH